MSRSKKKQDMQSFPFEFYCIAIGLRRGTDEFSSPQVIPMLYRFGNIYEDRVGFEDCRPL